MAGIVDTGRSRMEFVESSIRERDEDDSTEFYLNYGMTTFVYL